MDLGYANQRIVKTKGVYVSIVKLLISIGFTGFIVWLILQIPMPEPFRKVIVAIVCVVLILFVLQWFGIDTGIAAIRLK